MAQTFQSFSEFYPFYLSEHSDRTCRRLHFVGSTIGLGLAIKTIKTHRIKYAVLGLAVGYGMSWIGHFFFEKNRPATFQHPLYSFMGDWVMWKDIVTRKLEF